MAEERKNNTGFIITIVLLVILVLTLGGYITYDKLLRKEDTPLTEKKEQENKQVIETPTTGECPFTKLDSSYILTDKDKEELMKSIESLGFTREIIDINSFKIINTEPSYLSTIQLVYSVEEKKGEKLVASFLKVNGKMKVETVGSGFDSETSKHQINLVNRICS